MSCGVQAVARRQSDPRVSGGRLLQTFVVQPACWVRGREALHSHGERELLLKNERGDGGDIGEVENTEEVRRGGELHNRSKRLRHRRLQLAALAGSIFFYQLVVQGEIQ